MPALEEDLYQAAYCHSTERAFKLISNPAVDVNWQNEVGLTALHAASYKGCKEIVVMLLNHPKIQVNLKDVKGMTAVAFAASNITTRCLKVFLGDWRVDISIHDNLGRIPFSRAVSAGNTQAVKLLISLRPSQVEPKKKCFFYIAGTEIPFRMTPIEFCQAQGMQSMKSLLIEHASKSERKM